MERTKFNNNTATRTSTTNDPAFGILDMQMETQLKLTTHKGDILQNTRAGTIIVFKSNIGKVFDFTKTKAIHVVQKYFHSCQLA